MKDTRGLPRQAGGFTLIELMLTMLVVAIGVALAVPTFESITQRRHATSKAEQLASFIAEARSQSVKSNRQVSVQLTRTSADDWCIGAIESPNGCDCTTANACSIDSTEFVLTSTEAPKSKMTQFSADTVFVFDPVRGVKRAGDLAFHSWVIRSDNDEYELQVSSSPTGRVVVCNSDSTREVPGFKTCANAGVPAIPAP